MISTFRNCFLSAALLSSLRCTYLVLKQLATDVLYDDNR